MDTQETPHSRVKKLETRLTRRLCLICSRLDREVQVIKKELDTAEEPHIRNELLQTLASTMDARDAVNEASLAIARRARRRFIQV